MPYCQVKTDWNCYNKVMKFAERFREILAESGKTQVEVAKAVKVSKQCINDYKMGRSLPSLETFCLLCEYLEVTPDYLLGYSDGY